MTEESGLCHILEWRHNAGTAVERWLAQPPLDEPFNPLCVSDPKTLCDSRRTQLLERIEPILNQLSISASLHPLRQTPCNAHLGGGCATFSISPQSSDATSLDDDDILASTLNFPGSGSVYSNKEPWNQHLSSRYSMHRQTCLDPPCNPNPGSDYSQPEPKAIPSPNSAMKDAVQPIEILSVGCHLELPDDPSIRQPACPSCLTPWCLGCGELECTSEFCDTDVSSHDCPSKDQKAGEEFIINKDPLGYPNILTPLQITQASPGRGLNPAPQPKLIFRDNSENSITTKFLPPNSVVIHEVAS